MGGGDGGFLPHPSGKNAAQRSSIAAASANLMKNLIGAGLFSLPKALLAGSLLPGVGVMLLACAMQGGSFVLIAYLCHRLGANSYRGVMGAAFGSRAGDLVDVCIATNSFFACVSYNILFADFLQNALEGMFGWQAVSRRALVWANTLAISLPLSLLRDMSALRYTSLAGLAVVSFVIVFVTSDCARNMHIARPNFREHALRYDLGLFTTLAICTGAFQAHYNSPRFFREVGCSLDAHRAVVARSFGTAFLVYVAFAASGVGLFGRDLLGNVLRNYPPEGCVAVQAAWLGMAFAVAFTFPLVFTTGRDSLLSVVPAFRRCAARSPEATRTAATVAPVLLIACVACVVEDVSLVCSLLGCTIGACLCWIFPAVVYLRLSNRNKTGLGRPLVGGRPFIPNSAALRAYAWCLLAVGGSSAAVGLSRATGLL